MSGTQQAPARREPYYRRHPAQVTNHRLLIAYEQWFDRLSGEERDAISVIRNALHRIVDEDKSGEQG